MAGGPPVQPIARLPGEISRLLAEALTDFYRRRAEKPALTQIGNRSYPEPMKAAVGRSGLIFPTLSSTLEKILWAAAPAYALLAWRHNEAWRFLMSACLARSARPVLEGGGLALYELKR